jgi:hypothetical protein
VSIAVCLYCGRTLDGGSDSAVFMLVVVFC